MFYWQAHNAIVAAASGLMIGYCLGWTSTTQNALLRGDLGSPMTEDEFSWIGGILALGAAIFCIPAGILTNWLGRKKVFIMLSVKLVVGWACMLLFDRMWAMYVGRLLQGITIGGYCVVAPLFIGEITEKEIRGRFCAAFDLMLTVGVLLTYVLGAYFEVRISCYFGIGFALVYFILVLFILESPFYLVNKNRDEEAYIVLMKLRTIGYDINQEMAEIRQAALKNSDTGTIGVALRRRVTIKALNIGIGLMIFQQMCGINAIIFYTTDIFNLAESKLHSDTATIIIGVVQLGATVMGTLLIDSLGRRLLLFISGGGMAVFIAALAFYFVLLEKFSASLAAQLNWLPIVSLCGFIIIFSIGFGPVPWVMMGELFASEVKDVAASIAITVNWLLVFVVSKTYVNFKTAIGTGPTFIIYTISSILSVIFVLIVVIETKNKSLNEIQEELER